MADRRTAPVTLVLPTYNDAQFLPAALDSVASQSLQPSEIFIVDDGSDTNAAADVAEQVARHSGLPISYVRREHRGVAAARNAGLEVATQPFICYLDADDRWLPHHLQGKVARLSSLDERYASVYDGFLSVDPRGRPLWTPVMGAHDHAVRAELLWRPGGIPLFIGCHLYRRAALQAIGGFDESLVVGEDMDIHLRLGRAGYRVSGTPEQTFVRQHRPGSLTTASPERFIREAERWLAKTEREQLMDAANVAGVRKLIRLVVARELIQLGERGKAAPLLAEAWAIESPRGAGQWLLFASGRTSRRPSIALLRLLTWLRRARRRVRATRRPGATPSR